MSWSFSAWEDESYCAMSDAAHGFSKEIFETFF